MSIRRAAPAIALFFLSPLVAEFLLGDFTLAQLGYLMLLAPAYGGAAVVIREVARRAGRGWPTIVLLALAYGVVEEGLETQSLFNPDYLNAHLLDRGFVAALGISIPWTLFVLTLHTVWSMSAPIALVEEWVAARRAVPWLRLPGFVIAVVLAVLGGVGTFAGTLSSGHFMASPAQLVTSGVVAVALVVAAFLIPARRPVLAGPAPSPWLVLALPVVAGVLVMLGWRMPATWGSAVLVVALAAAVVLLLRWSARAGWDGRRRWAAASGAILVYVGHGFLMDPVVKASAVMVVTSHVVFALAAVLLLAVGARRVFAARPAAGVRAATGPLAHPA